MTEEVKQYITKSFLRDLRDLEQKHYKEYETQNAKASGIRDLYGTSENDRDGWKDDGEYQFATQSAKNALHRSFGVTDAIGDAVRFLKMIGYTSD